MSSSFSGIGLIRCVSSSFARVFARVFSSVARTGLDQLMTDIQLNFEEQDELAAESRELEEIERGGALI